MDGAKFEHKGEIRYGIIPAEYWKKSQESF